LRGFLAALKGREKVQVICMDISSPYRALARRWFPHARIVADRFHVIRSLQHHFLGRDALVTMWRFTKNNGITEGFHRKMKLIQRRAYGFRNFYNYRLRVIAQCG